MSRGSGKVHVVRVRKTHVNKQGNAREYSSAYLRRTYREGKRVRNETVANLSALPEHVVDWIDAGLKGGQLVPAGAAWWPDVTLGPDLDVAGASTDEIYAAMDWLLERQDAIESNLAAKHLGPEVNPQRMALFDLTSAWVTGRCCELAARGYSRDGKKGCE